METATRTVVKATVWILFGWVVMALVGLAFTGSLAIGGTMAALNSAIGFGAYLAYERIWTHISWGRNA